MADRMDNAIVHAKIVGYTDENPPDTRNHDFESSKEDCLSEISAPETLKKLQITDFCAQKLLFQQMSGLKKRIPKQMMSLEEKYLRHCLGLIQMSAMRANSWPMPSKVSFLPDGFSSRVNGGSGCDALFLFSSGDENVVISSSVDPIVGSITGSKSMMNLLNSPLLRHASDDDKRFENTSTIGFNEPLNSPDLQKKRVVPKNQIFESEPLHQRVVSLSSTNSTFSVPSSSSSSSSGGYCQGMLHCSWNDGSPHYVFSVEDQREVYTTNLSKVESFNEGTDYIYMFHSKCRDDGSDLVGKMRVSTSFTPGPGTEIMETRFILCATEQHSDAGIHISNQTVRKSKGLSRKVTSILRGNHSYRRRTFSKFDGSFAIQESSLEAKDEGSVLQESSCPSNLELAAIVVKDHIPYGWKKAEVGGWGLKFLKEGTPATEPVACEGCRQDTGRHCSSMDVIIPADFHGGPKSGGPSSLVERWRSGGSCDCGGWDIGCPLTVLNAGLNYKDVAYQAGVFGKSNSFELFMQGSTQNPPVVEVKNIHDGLYYIHYQSTLSALQSLSIAVAIIHSHSPTLKPKVYRN